MTRRAPRSTLADGDRLLVAAALDDVVGPVLVLDAQLRIRVATPMVVEVLGFVPPLGAARGRREQPARAQLQNARSTTTTRAARPIQQTQ